MKRVSIVALLLSAFSYAQQPLNLGFEEVIHGTSQPLDWKVKTGNDENYKISVDSDAKEGKNSLLIESKEGSQEYATVQYHIPNRYNGKKMIVTGFIKSKNVKGKAGIAYSLNRQDRMLTYSAMIDNAVSGTTEWTEYQLELDLHPKAEAIVLELGLYGEGQVWYDDLKVFIDGKNIEELELNALPRAVTDKEFDNSSNFKVNSLSPKEIDNLVALGKAWGKLKYTNPKIGNGEYNWDYELFRALPLIRDKNFDKKLKQWKESYGEESNSIPEYHYYVDFLKGSNAFLINEKTYEDSSYDDQGYRLLTLFRYWNGVEYFFAYKDLLKRDWDEVLKEFIPRFLFAKDEVAYKLEIKRMGVELEDSHAIFVDRTNALSGKLYGSNAVPIKVAFIDDKLVVTEVFDSLSKSSTIQVGDEIIEIDRRQLADVVEERIKNVAGSNRSYRLAILTHSILVTTKDNLPLVLKGKQGVFSENTSTVASTSINLADKPRYKPMQEFNGGDIGYIHLEQLEKEDLDTIKSNFMSKKGIVIDLRGYPADLALNRTLVPYFLSHKEPFVKFTMPSTGELGKFNLDENLYVGSDNPNYFKGKVALLVNHRTISHGEFMTMAFQVLPNVKTFGTQTAGADGNVVLLDLLKGVQVYFTGLGTFYPDGRQTQQVGIHIDEVVKPTIEDIRIGRDTSLERALEYLRE